jgi:hypothetical protein
MGRFGKAFLGSSLAAAIGFAAGLIAATAYERAAHPNDPDPVDFNVGAVFLVVWIAIWLIGTLGSAWWAFRRRSANAL